MRGRACDARAPGMAPREAHAAGARALVLSAASIGGAIRDSWIPYLVDALEAGLDIISGAHDRLGDNPQLRQAAEACGRRLIDVRTPPPSLPIETGRRRSGKRLLTVEHGRAAVRGEVSKYV